MSWDQKLKRESPCVWGQLGKQQPGSGERNEDVLYWVSWRQMQARGRGNCDSKKRHPGCNNIVGGQVFNKDHVVVFPEAPWTIKCSGVMFFISITALGPYLPASICQTLFSGGSCQSEGQRAK